MQLQYIYHNTSRISSYPVWRDIDEDQMIDNLKYWNIDNSLKPEDILRVAKSQAPAVYHQRFFSIRYV